MSQKRTAQIFLCSVAFTLTVNCFPVADETAWRIYSEERNGDVHFFDTSRVEKTSSLHRVWTRIRYKRSVMAAASFQSLLEIDCTERTARTLQRTFFTDKDWENPAMKTDTKPKKKRSIEKGSATDRLSEVLCSH